MKRSARTYLDTENPRQIYGLPLGLSHSGMAAFTYPARVFARLFTQRAFLIDIFFFEMETR